MFTGPLHVRRIGSPRWAQSNESFRLPEGFDRRFTGEQAEWGWGIPLVHQAVASPFAGLPVPRRPHRGCKRSDATGYWASLLHLCLYSLGWVRPERGLLALSSDDWPWTIDPETEASLALIERIWKRDGQLDLFIAWLSRWGVLDAVDDFEVLAQRRFDRSPTGLDRDWLDRQTARAERVDHPTPNLEGDSLHLSSHCRAPIIDPAEYGPTTSIEAAWYRDSGNRRTATLVTDSMHSWYRLLIVHARDLPERGAGWQIDVVAKPVGWLGTFRRSPNTDIWHSVSESTHMLAH